MKNFFTILSRSDKSKARTGIIKTPHGNILTPAFLPVGTLGAPKAIHIIDLLSSGTQIIMSNTYHLYLKPGIEVIKKAGGLHKFTSWHKPIMTDSGGYQIFSLQNTKVSEEGVRFQSPYDGSYHFFTPEKVIHIQRALGSDIAVALDICPPYTASQEYVKWSLEITKNWYKRALYEWNNTEPQYGFEQVLCPVLQGGMNKDLRKHHIEWLFSTTNPEPKIVAIGGLSVGEPAEVMYEIIDLSTDYIPENTPRHLLGVGTPANIIECVLRGVDTFDCVIPTRNGRRGLIYTWQGTIYIHNEKWKYDFSPIDIHSRCPLAKIYSKAFLRHLLKADEILGMMIATTINLFFYLDLMQEIRKQINQGTFESWAKEMIKILDKRL